MKLFRILQIIICSLFILSSLTKAVNILTFAQTIKAFCALLGQNELYGYGVILAILICTLECLLPLLSTSNRYKGVVFWCYPDKNVILSLLTFVLLALHILEQWSHGASIFPSLRFDAYIVLALAVSIMPSIFSFFFLNRLPHIPYLLLYMALCVMGLLFCVKYVTRNYTSET